MASLALELLSWVFPSQLCDSHMGDFVTPLTEVPLSRCFPAGSRVTTLCLCKSCWAAFPLCSGPRRSTMASVLNDEHSAAMKASANSPRGASLKGKWNFLDRTEQTHPLMSIQTAQPKTKVSTTALWQFQYLSRAACAVVQNSSTQNKAMCLKTTWLQRRAEKHTLPNVGRKIPDPMPQWSLNTKFNLRRTVLFLKAN